MTAQLVLNVTELLEQPGSRKAVCFDEQLSGLANELAQVHDPMRFELMLESLDDGILVRGPISGRYAATCRRCLEEAGRPFSVEVAELYRPPGSVWEEGYVIANETIDLQPMVRDNVLLDMPLYPLCSEGCRGLCPRCGVNRNRQTCTCADVEVDLRWAPLQQLLDS